MQVGIPFLIFKLCSKMLCLLVVCSLLTALSSSAMFTSPESATVSVDNMTIRSETRTPLYIGGFFPLGGGWDGSGVVPVVEMALDHINERKDILPGYELRMVWNDTQCEAGLGTRVLFDQIYSNPQKLILLGGGCSTATQAISATAYHWNLVTMSYAASSSALSNREVYPYFYRTYMPDAMFNPARVRLMKEYGWKRVATIHENHELFSLAIDDLLNILAEHQNNITVISSESFAENPRNQVQNLKNQDAKIIVANMYGTKARRVFCEAYRQGITGKGYVWMLIGWYNDKWWEVEDTNCNRREMEEAVKGYISVESLQLGAANVVTVADITSADYVSLLKERLTWPQYRQYDWNTLAPYGYDAAWAIALMLNKTMNELRTKRFSDNTTKRLEDFNYDDDEMAKMFFDTLKELYFIGITGPVSFKNGDRVGITQIEQLKVVCEKNWYLFNDYCYRLIESSVSWSGANLSCYSKDSDLAPINNNTKQFIRTQAVDTNIQSSQAWIGTPDGNCGSTSQTGANVEGGHCFTIRLKLDGGCEPMLCASKIESYICRRKGELREVRIGLYDVVHGNLTLSPILWPDDEIPLDHTPDIIINVVRINEGVTVELFLAITVVAIIGIILALFFLVFNLKFRKLRSVKLSSPYLNNLIILGSIVIFGWVILYGLGSDFVSIQTLQVVCQIRHWLLSVGFVLAFGAMFGKTWRVYRVVTFKTPKRVIVSDTQLFLMVLVLLCFDLVLLVIWQIVDPMFVDTTKLFLKDDLNVANQKIQPHFEFCNCAYYFYWLVAIGGYKGLLMIFGAFLAWETRKVTFQELNDSKLIGICVYNVVILCVVGIAVTAALGSSTTSYIFLTSIVLFCTSVTLVVIFVPKIISVVKHPDGKPMVNASGKTPGQNMSSNDNSNETYTLRSQVIQLEEELRKSNNQFKCTECGSIKSGNLPDDLPVNSSLNRV